MKPRLLSLRDARRISLAALGLDRPRPKRATADHVRAVIRRLGLVQIDYVNVLVPAQYQVLFARVGAFPLRLLDDLVYRRREFVEHWAHEAAVLPVESWPLFRHRMEGRNWRHGVLAHFMSAHEEYAARVLAHVVAHGPVAASEVLEPDGSAGHWMRDRRPTAAPTDDPGEDSGD